MEPDSVKSLTKYLLVVPVFLLLFIALGVSVVRTPPLDIAVASSVHSIVDPILTTVMRSVTWTGDAIAAGVTLILVVVFWLRSHRDRAVLFAVCVGGAATANEGIKQLFQRPRPDLFAPLAGEIGYSFPSGHTTTAAALYGLSALLLWRSGHRIFAGVLVLWVLLVGFSRIYLAVHWPSDVLGSLLFSVAWLVVVVGIYDRIMVRRTATVGGRR